MYYADDVDHRLIEAVRFAEVIRYNIIAITILLELGCLVVLPLKNFEHDDVG